MIIGSGEYEVVENWLKLPVGFSVGDAAGIASDSKDRIFVFNRGRHPMMVFDREGNFLGHWGEGFFSQAHSVRRGPDDMLFCVDYGNHTVTKFTPEGTPLMILGMRDQPSDTGAIGLDFRSIRRAAGPLDRPTDVAFGPMGEIFVSDGYGNSRIHRFSRDGHLLSSWGAPGSGPAEFHVPHSIFVYNLERVLVADRENSRVQVFTLAGEFIDQWSDANRPVSILAEKDGTILVLEAGYIKENMFDGLPIPSDRDVAPRITFRKPDGTMLSKWGGTNRDNFCDPGNFWAPHSICADSRGDLYVGEVVESARAPTGCHAVQKFKKR